MRWLKRGVWKLGIPLKRTIFLPGKPTDDISVHLVYNAEGRYANIVGM